MTQGERDDTLRSILRDRYAGFTTTDVAQRLHITPTGARRRLQDAKRRGVVVCAGTRPERWMPAQAHPSADRGLLLVEALRRFTPFERPEAVCAAAMLLNDDGLVALVRPRR